jgi:hypothetical protein
MEKFAKILMYVGLGILSILAALGIVKGVSHMIEKRRSGDSPALTDGQ